jgi:hypothetical protein
MDRGRVGEDRGSKEMDGCPLTGCVRGLSVQVQSTSIGIPGGSAHKGVCIAAGVTAAGGCERMNEKGVRGGAGYVVGVGAE